jgi:glucosylceramidase
MEKRFFSTILTAVMLGVTSTGVWAQRVVTYRTTEGAEWQQGKTALSNKAEGNTIVSLNGDEQGVPFQAWGTTFNELDWDAFNLLTRD